MFRNVYLKQGLYLLGSAAVTYYSYWFINEIINHQVQHDANFTGNGLSDSATQINSFLFNEELAFSQLQKITRFDHSIAIDATELDWQNAKEDRTFVINTVMQVARQNPLDACKLSMLLNFSPNFLIRITKQLDRSSSSALYEDGPNYITFPVGVRHKFPKRTQETVTHELKHAIDTHNNLKNGLCLWDRGGVTRTKYFIHSKGKTVSECANDINGLTNLNNIINSDVDRLEKIYKSSIKPAASRTAEENKLIKGLDVLIKKYNYQQRTYNMVDNNPGLIEAIEEYYQFDEESQSYKFMDRTVYELDWEYQHGKTIIRFNRYLIEYKPSTNESLYVFSDVTDQSPDNLRNDLLRNVLLDLGVVFQVHTGFEQPAEISAHIEEIVAPYSKVVRVGERSLNLKTFLFPKLDAYEKTRHEPVFAQCLDQRVYKPR